MDFMEDNELKVGVAAPDFTLLSTLDREISLSQYRGKRVLLFFVREYV